MAPVVHGLQKKYADQIKFVYLNMDDPATDGFQEKLRVTYRPEFFLLGPDGTVLKRFVGFVPAEKLEAEFALHIK